ncbi:STAS domain-containing protein [Streptomyces sp. NPDC015131]|uniref:STAS domain-containing protein n=1 Tax=Streptomyces sp. NPDC015131 TaxID=3364941 RepID=UPI003701DAEA
MSDEAEITTTLTDDVRVVRIIGDFDLDSTDDFEQAFAVPADGSVRATVADLSRVTFADSSFLHLLLSARQRHQSAGLPLVLADISPLVRRLLDLTDTARVFAIAPHLLAAMETARGAEGSRTPRP